MRGLVQRIAWAWVWSLAAGGCALTPQTNTSPTAANTPPANTPGATASTTTSAQGTGQTPATNAASPALPHGTAMPVGTPPSAGAAATAPKPNLSQDSRAIQDLVTEIAKMEHLDMAAQEKLAEDLRQTDPAAWPTIVQTLRASMAYRRQLQQREAAQAILQNEKKSPGVPPPLRTLASVDRNSYADDPARVRAKTPRMTASMQDETGNPPPQRESPAEEILIRPRRSTGGQADRMTPENSVADKKRDEPRAVAPDPEDRATTSDRQRLAAADPAPGKDKRSSTAKTTASDAAPSGRRSGPGQDAADSKTNRIAAKDGNSPAGRVTQVSYETDPSAWREQLAAAIASLESQVRESPQSAADIAQQARLRMLYVAANRRDDALKPIPSAPPPVQDFWSQELYGLSTILDTQRQPDTNRRAGEAKQHFHGAMNRLGELAPLAIRNLSMITEVQSYGVYKTFDKYQFAPGQELLLYAEVENFKSEETPKGFQTSLRGNYQIFDGRGQRVGDWDLGTTEEHCRSPRRDFFLGYHLRLPKRIYPGKHTLQLTVEDTKSQKIAQSSVDFTVKENAE